MSFKWRGRTIARGEKAFFAVPVCTMASGYELTLPVHVLAGRRPGPAVMIATTSHGDQIWESEFCRRFHDRLMADGLDFNGALVLCPLLNPIAFESGTRNSWVDMHNLNRVFPGSESGTNWFTDALAGVIMREIVAHVDAVIDYHGGSSNTVIRYTYTPDPNVSAATRFVYEMALATGAEVIWEHAQPPGSLSGACAAVGKPAVLFEVGGGSVIEDESEFADAIAATGNVLRLLTVFDGEPTKGRTRIVVRKGVLLRPKHGGLFSPVVGADKVGKTLEKGTVLGRVYSPHTFAVLDELVAPFARTEVMQVRTRTCRVHPGTYAYILGDGDSGYSP
jgi:predicted deacylase